MPEIAPYLSFDGNCAEAMRFYERVLNGKLKALLTNSQTPVGDQMPPGNEDRIMHARLEAEGIILMGGDTMVGTKHEGMKGLALTVSYENVDEAQRVFDGLAEGGKVTMPWSPTFWAERFGMLTDRYGIHWIVNGALHALPPMA
jgi:PhnB protein